MKLNKVKEAYSTLEHGLRYSERNWRMWQNLMRVSLQCQKFGRFLDSIQKLMELEHSEVIS